MNRPLQSVCVLSLGVALLVSCSSSSRESDRAAFDRAIETFVSGDYEAAASAFSSLASAADTDAGRRDAYYYLGRAYLEMGETDRAIEAFSAGVSYGDDGPCAEYLARLKPYVEGGVAPLRSVVTVSRGQLAGALVRLLSDEAMGIEQGNPLDIAARRRWMPSLPDGAHHEDAVVTRAYFYLTVTRVVSGWGGDIRAILPDGAYARALRDNAPVPGNEVATVLERLIELKNHGG